MENEQIKKGFFRRIWYSITKIEKYPNMAAEGVPKALSYFSKIILMFSIIFSLGLLYQVNNMVQDGAKYLKNQFPEIQGYANGNFVKVPAGWLIENAGWKGKQIGNVASHKLQALVIINATGEATGKEIYDFSTMIIDAVKKQEATSKQEYMER